MKSAKKFVVVLLLVVVFLAYVQPEITVDSVAIDGGIQVQLQIEISLENNQFAEQGPNLELACIPGSEQDGSNC